MKFGVEWHIPQFYRVVSGCVYLTALYLRFMTRRNEWRNCFGNWEDAGNQLNDGLGEVAASGLLRYAAPSPHIVFASFHLLSHQHLAKRTRTCRIHRFNNTPNLADPSHEWCEVVFAFKLKACHSHLPEIPVPTLATALWIVFTP